MSQRITPSPLPRVDEAEPLDHLGLTVRDSLDSLGSQGLSLQNEGDTTSLDLNDDLASYSGRSAGNNSLAFSRRSFESSSIFTSSFRPSFDDSQPSLGLNKLSIQRVSPLGPNSIYELIADVDAKKMKSSSSLSPSVNRVNRTKINILPPTQRDIPPIQLSKLEKASKDEFKAYLIEVSKEYEKYYSNKQLTANSLQTLAKKQESQNAGINDILENEPDSLDTIPQIYFSEDFNLDDPRVFKQVTEKADLESFDGELQDKLSWYLDTIESHLVNEISKASTSFFDALNDLSVITENNQKAIELIEDLQGKVKILEEKKIQHNLDTLKLKRKRDNVSKLEQSLLQIDTVLKEAAVAESLFFQGEYESCLDKVDYIGELIHGKAHDLQWPHPLQDLSQLPALQDIRQKLSSLKSKTGDSYTNIFIDYLMEDLRKHYEDIDYTKTLERLTMGKNYQRVIDDDFKSKLSDYIVSLSRTGEIVTALKSYEDNVVNEMKNIVRTFLPNEETISSASGKDGSSVASSRQVSGAKSLSSLIKIMTPCEFEDMLLKVYATVSEGLRRLTVHQKLLLDLALSNTDPKDQSVSIMQLDIRNAINKSIEIIQIRMGKIITVRKDLNANLRFDYFIRLYYINSVFLNECESISGINYKFLPDVINSQVRNFITTFHSSNLKRISRTIEEEEWKPLIVSQKLQAIVNDIVDNKDLDTEQIWKKDLLDLRDQESSSTVEEEKSSHKRSVVVNDKTFVANNSLLVLITIIRDIFILKANFHHLSGTYEANLIELIKYYTGRAMQSVKKPDGSLNRDKNLSVLGESLDCTQELIHYIRVDFDNLDLDDQYNSLIGIITSAKGKIDSINMIPD